MDPNAIVAELQKKLGPNLESINKRLEDYEQKLKAAEERAQKVESEKTAVDEAIKELRERLSRRETLDPETGVRESLLHTGRLQHSVSRECGKHVVELLRASARGRNARALSEGVDAEGGYLVAPEFAAEILRLIPQVGLYRRIARTVPMSSDEINFGTLASGITVYWPAENVAITLTEPAFGQLKLTVKTLAAYTEAPETLLDDASPDVGQFIVELFVEAIAKEEDRVGFYGDAPTDAYDGIAFASGVNALALASTKTHISDVHADDLLTMQTTVPEGGREGGVYVLSPTVLDGVRKMKDTAGNYIWQPPTAGAPATIWGRPYYTTERMPAWSTSVQASKKFLLYGEPRYLFLGDRKQISVRASDVSGTTFQKIQTAIRAHERVSISSYASAWCVLQTAAS